MSQWFTNRALAFLTRAGPWVYSQVPPSPKHKPKADPPLRAGEKQITGSFSEPRRQLLIPCLTAVHTQEILRGTPT